MNFDVDPMDIISTNIEDGEKLDGNPSTPKYLCPRCKHTFTYRQTFNRHIKECGQLPRFQCPFCSHRSKRNSNLQNHIRCLHNLKKVGDRYVEDKKLPLKSETDFEMVKVEKKDFDLSESRQIKIGDLKIKLPKNIHIKPSTSNDYY